MHPLNVNAAMDMRKVCQKYPINCTFFREGVKGTKNQGASQSFGDYTLNFTEIWGFRGNANVSLTLLVVFTAERYVVPGKNICFLGAKREIKTPA